MFESKGWSVRKSSWTDFEISTPWGELTIESDDNSPLINGAIDQAMFNALQQVLSSLGLKYSI